MASHAGSPRSAIASWKMPIDLFLSKDTGLTSACREGEEDSSNACGRGSRTVNTISGEKVASWAGKGLSPHRKAMGVVEQRRGGNTAEAERLGSACRG